MKEQKMPYNLKSRFTKLIARSKAGEPASDEEAKFAQTMYTRYPNQCKKLEAM